MAASSGGSIPTSKSGKSAGLKMSWTGRRTCASASARSLEAQPAQFERLVNRICFPDVASGSTMLFPFIEDKNYLDNYNPGSIK
jgi:hypothetical protein